MYQEPHFTLEALGLVFKIFVYFYASTHFRGGGIMQSLL